MRKFSIPYNNDRLLLKKLMNTFPDYKNQCKEIYFAIPNRFAGTGRAVNQDKDYENNIMDILKEAHDNCIESNLLINSGCLNLNMTNPEFIDHIINYIGYLKEYANLDVVTASDYCLAKSIKRAFPEIKLECSSIAYVDSLEKAKYWEELGCNILVIPPVLNKNLQFISELHKNLPNVELKLVINQTCLHGCPMWHSHHNLRGHGNEGSVYWDACHSFFKEKPWLLYSSSFIPPKYLSYYDEIIRVYKLVDRRHPTKEILKSFGAYCGDTDFQETIDELNGKIPKEVFAKVIHCNKQCSSCGFCEANYLRIS